MESRSLLAVLALAAITISGCGGGSSSGGGSSGGGGTTPPPAATTYSATSGVAQKGPLILGSAVTAQELSTSLTPTGKQYSYQTNSDFGTFVPNSTFSSQYIGVNATGYYFDEVANAVSDGPVTLNAYSDLSTTSVLNVNLLTTLAYQRIQNLVSKSGMTFTAAQTQAQGEVLAALNIRNGSGYGPFDTLDISKGTDGDNILTAISSLFVYGNTSGNLSSLIAAFQNDLGTNGVITSTATSATLAAAAKALSPATVAANLNQKYAAAGVSFTATDISNWIDQDGDGLVGKFKFQVPDATQTSVFTFPAFVTDPNAGTSISVTVGVLSVNGAPVSGATQIKTGDVVSVSPPSGAFPNGMLTAYLLSGTTKIGRVSFVSGLESIAVTPDSPSLAVDLTQQFKATGTFSDGSTADLTASATWSSSAPAIASVSLTSGLANALTVGSTSITATSGSISGTTTLTVIAATLQSIQITPNPLTTGVGIPRQVTATGTYSDGSKVTVTSLATWSTGDPTIATVTGGLVTGVSLASTTVTATLASVTGTATVNVTAHGWSAAASMLHQRAEHTATLLANGKVFVAMGQGFGACCDPSSEIYDPLTDKWTGAASWYFGIFAHTATLLPNGTVLVAGGNGNGSALANSEIYDPATDSWAATAPLVSARFSHTATALQGGKVLVDGGIGNGSSVPLPTAEMYDPATSTWSSAGSMTTGRAGHTATLLSDGRVLVTGGINTAQGTATTSAEIYDPTANTWSSAGNMLTARSGHTATLLPNGTVLVAGASQNVYSAEIYDPVANSWSPTGSMYISVTGATATLLPSNKVMVVGAANGTITTSQIYDPVAGTWSSAGNLLTYHSNQTATLLPNGALLIEGGTTAACELYW